MSRRRVPDPQLLWERHVERVLRILCLALERLHAEKGLPVAEKQLDRWLCLKARDAYHSLGVSERPLSFGLHPKAEQTPADEQHVDEEWVGKKPDFKWRMQNDLAATPRELTRDFDIESKRLGRPTSRGWVLAKQYVVEGIVRFLSASHRYGNGVDAGAMIGYVQDSLPSEILAEVNRHIGRRTEHAIPTIRFPGDDYGTEPVMRTRQELARSEVDPSRFILHHLWVDLRRN